MKLFLASSLDQTISELNKESPLKDKRVLFITNAADNQTDTWWVDLDRKAFEELGGKIVDIDLRKTTKEEFSKILEEVDLVHVCGGSVLYLISLLRKNDLEEILKKAILENKIFYTGTSAGSMIVSKDVTLVQYDEEEAPFIKDMNGDFSGLGLVDFYINPHSQNPIFTEANIETMKHLQGNKSPLIFLNDNQAVLIKDDWFKIISI